MFVLALCHRAASKYPRESAVEYRALSLVCVAALSPVPKSYKRMVTFNFPRCRPRKDMIIVVASARDVDAAMVASLEGGAWGETTACSMRPPMLLRHLKTTSVFCQRKAPTDSHLKVT